MPERDLSPSRILLVEDEPGSPRALSERLARAGYEIEVATSDVAIERAGHEPFDLVLIDQAPPTRRGFDVCVALRQAGVDTPIIVLSVRDQLGDRVAAFRLGADDYLVKPFEPAELLARIEARLRRTAPRVTAQVFRFGDVTVDVTRAVIERGGRAVKLGAKEFRLLCYFLERPGEALPRDELLEQVWGYSAATSSRTLDVHVASLRRKLEPNPRRPQHLVTIHGLGYKLIA